MPENQYLSQYFVGLPSKISSFIKRRIDVTSLIGAYPSPVKQLFFSQQYLQRVEHNRDLNDLHFYKYIFWAEGFVCHKQ